MTTPLPELGCYLLAGQPDSSRDLVAEVRDAEALGLGAAFISERYNKKEAGALCGAAGAASERIRIITAATNHNTRHPMVTAGLARTMQSLTGGRFTLGLGRGIPALQDAFGIPRITTAELEDFAGIMRRLFRGEAIFGHDGPAGSWPVLHLDSSLDEHLPLALVAFGDRTLELAGRCFDDVVLHTYFTDEVTARCVELVKNSAADASRRLLIASASSPTCGCGRASPPWATTSPPRCGSRRRWAGSAPTCRATGSCWSAPTGGTGPCCNGSSPTR